MEVMESIGVGVLSENDDPCPFDHSNRKPKDIKNDLIGIGTTLGEKMGSAHMNPAQGTAAQASAIIGIGLANFGGMPVSTTHVLSAAVLGSVVGTRGEKVNMHTVGKIAITWFTTLPGTVIVSFILSVIFYLALV